MAVLPWREPTQTQVQQTPAWPACFCLAAMCARCPAPVRCPAPGLR
jgi:hypothetical protein